MIEEKTKTTLDKIEELIVGGQKEVLDRISLVETNLGQRIGSLEEGQKRLDQKIDAVHSSLKHEIVITAYAVKDDIKEVGKKLDAHLRVAA